MDKSSAILTAPATNANLAAHILWLPLCILMTLTACQTPIPDSVSAEPALIFEPVDPRIPALLDDATRAFAADRLTEPLDDNAYFRYLQILSIDPANPDANLGLSDIVEKYLEWSINSMRAGARRSARDYLNKAKSVDENHPSIAAVENMMVVVQANRGRETHTLASDAVAARTPEVVAALRDIAAQIETHKASIIIEAASDATGRWLYQRLNEMTEERIRARFELNSLPRIHLVY